MGATFASALVKENPLRRSGYKAVCLHEQAAVLASFQDNAVVIDWVNTQPLASVLTCLGDGHDGIWNIVSQFAPPTERRELLDWFHLMENLHKVGGSLQRLNQAKSLLWQGQVDAAQALFSDSKLTQAQNFCAYLNKHRHRIVNYQYYQAEQICSIASGAVESTVKQIDRRTKISLFAVEGRKCASSLSASVRLSEWTNLCQLNKKWDAPVSPSVTTKWTGWNSIGYVSVVNRLSSLKMNDHSTRIKARACHLSTAGKSVCK